MRVGVIGTGWGLMHVGAFRAAGAEVVGLCGRDAAKTVAIAAREGIALATTEVRELVDAVDVVVVASADGAHRRHVEAVLGAGRRVLCEKPLALTYEDALAMTRLDPAAAMVFPYRLLPTFVAARDWLSGRPARVIVTVRSGFGWTAESGDLGGTSHVIDAVSWLLQREPVAVRASLGAGVSALHVEYAGAMAIITWLHAPEPGIHGGWSIVGDGVEAGFSAGYVPAAGGWCLGALNAFEGAWREVHPAVVPGGGLEPWAAAHHLIARRFVDGGELATFADGLRVHAVLEAARVSSERGVVATVRPSR